MDAQVVSQVLGWVPPTLHGATVLAIIWLVQLKAKTDQNTDNIERLEREAKDDRAAIWAEIKGVRSELSVILQGVSRLEGKLDRDFNIRT